MTPLAKNKICRHPSAASAAERLENDLRSRIRKGDTDYEIPIDSEPDLSRSYGICRNTVRKVLQVLTDEGLLFKRHGLGTFIRRPELRQEPILSKILAIGPHYEKSYEELDLYDRRLLSGINDYIYFNCGRLKMSCPGDSAARLKDQFRALKFDGIIWQRPDVAQQRTIRELHSNGIPQVTISRRVEGVPSLFFDYPRGVREVLHFLRGIGHSEIVFVDLDLDFPVFRDRQKVFLEEIAENGAARPEKYIYRLKYDGVSNEMIGKIFREHPRLTALFFAVSHAPGFSSLLPARGVRIPEDVSLVSLDESDFTSEDGRLSVISEPSWNIGRRAAEILRRLVNDPTAFAEPEYFKGELIVRKSCASPGKHLTGAFRTADK